MYIFRAKTDHWCSKPPGIDYDESTWKELAIPHKEEISKSCASVESGAAEKLHYETCKMYDVDFEGLFKTYEGDFEKY